MTTVGLTGGIGAGKSTVGRALAARGALVIDADQVAREVVEPGGPAYQGVVERFGAGVLRPDGTLDRAALAAVVFADAEARADLEAITHPAIGRVMAERIAEADPGRVVVLEIPLLSAATRAAYGLDAVIVVDAPEDTAVARLVGQRGFTEDDARARIAAQMPRAERRALADLVVDNGGGREALAAEVDRVWTWLQDRQGSGPPC